MELRAFDVQLAASLRADHLQLILLPTERCNFRCTYCYEDFSLGRMPTDVINGIKSLIDRRAGGLKQLQLSWFGGEPLLARSIIEDISQHALMARNRHPDLRYLSDMTTNGYLLDGDAADRLAELGIRRFQVPLDGPEPYHDRTRRRADGEGTFARIWRNLLSIRQGSADVHIMLRIHLTPENIESLPEFVSTVRKELLCDKRFTVFLKRVVHLGGPNDVTTSVLDADDPRIGVLTSIVRGSSDRDEALFVPEDVCYAARANSLLIRSDGRIGKCTVALSDPANDIGRLRPDGTIVVNNAALRPWLHGWESRDSDLISCPYLAFTHGRGQESLIQITKRGEKSDCVMSQGPKS